MQCLQSAPSVLPPDSSHAHSIPQGGVDPSLAERLLEEASSRAEDLRDENIRLRELLIGHLQTLWTLSDNMSDPAGVHLRGDEG